jgi:hypothetical protein
VAASDPRDVRIDWDGGWWPATEGGHPELVSRVGSRGQLQLAVADPDRLRRRLLHQGAESVQQRLENATSRPPDEVTVHRVVRVK